MKIKADFFNSLSSVLLIVLIIPGVIPIIVSAADGDVEDDGNSSINELPDLIIEDLSFSPRNPGSGETVNITATVKNQGNETSGTTNLAYYSNGEYIGEGEVPEIEAGESEQISSFSWTWETESTVEITAKVNEENSVPESDEDNNEKTKILTFKKTRLPDLIIDTFNYPENPKFAGNESIQISVKNQGTSTSNETKLKLYIDETEVSEWNIPQLSAGETSNTESTTWTWTPTSKGSVRIKVVVDEVDLVEESDEDNNQKTVTVTVVEDTPPDILLPDLIIEDIMPESAAPQVGNPLNIIMKVTNQGMVPSEAVMAKYHINGTAANDINDISIPSLSEGESINVSFFVPSDKIKEGPIEVKVFVDSHNIVDESDETNNEFTKIINIIATPPITIPPDLTIESLSVNPETPESGENITFTVTAKNNGPGASSRCELKYNINGNNETFERSRYIPALAAGETAEVSFYWTSDVAGQIEIKLMMDSEAVVQESDETNNEFTKIINIIATPPITIPPDLTIESLSVNPEAPEPWENITFTVTMKNNGPGDSLSCYLKYDINGTNDSGQIVVPALAAGEKATGTFFWTPTVEGQIEVKLMIDSVNAAHEKDETNNELIKTIKVAKETSSGGSSGSGSSSGSSSKSKSSSKSSSGGAGGGSPEPANNVKVKELSQVFITSGNPIKFEFLNNATAIVNLSFDSKKTVGKTTTIVEMLKNKSTLTPDAPTGQVYTYLNIWVGNGGYGSDAGNLENAVINFKVEKSWVQGKGIDKSSIILNRYSDKKWNELPTTLLREDDTYLYFTAETPGFSPFAITEYTGLGEEKEENRTQVEENKTQAEATVQETLGSWDGEGKAILNASAEKEGGKAKKLTGKTKILIAIFLPLFMLLIEYFILKKKL